MPGGCLLGRVVVASDARFPGLDRASHRLGFDEGGLPERGLVGSGAIARFGSSTGECNVGRFHGQRDSGECGTQHRVLESLDSFQSSLDRDTTFPSTPDPVPGFGPGRPERNAS